MRPAATLLAGSALLIVTAVLFAQRPDAFQGSRDDAAIQYTAGPVDNAVSRVNRGLDTGKIRLDFNQANGYLVSLLGALDVPIESQLLVFSETSAQAELINPRNPRAVFFNDRVSVGWVRGGDVLEIAAQDPRQGVIFYTLEQKAAAKPRLKRNNQCLLCHLTWDTLGVPGILTISTFPMSDDKNAYATGVVVDQRTALDQRWGGWYVTGKAVPARHFGNLPVIRPERELKKVTPTPVLESVQGRFETKGYPSVSSDIVAHLVMGHQAHMTNLLTRLGWEDRLAQNGQADGRAVENERVKSAARDLVDYLLFADEAPIGRKIEGSSGFAEKFSAEGPKDAKGRSLRQLDLEHRLMRYPCSYMIYSEAFEALPASAKDAVYRRLWQILSGQEPLKAASSLSLANRQAIVEILRDTKKNLPPYFQPVTR